MQEALGQNNFYYNFPQIGKRKIEQLLFIESVNYSYELVQYATFSKYLEIFCIQYSFKNNEQRFSYY